MAKMKETNVGSEYRVRTSGGKIKGEYDSEKKANQKKEQLNALKRGRK